MWSSRSRTSRMKASTCRVSFRSFVNLVWVQVPADRSAGRFVSRVLVSAAPSVLGVRQADGAVEM
jgi:hypothetical protein